MVDLFDVGAALPKVVLRTPTRRDGEHICPECGSDLGDPGTVKVPVSAIADPRLARAFDGLRLVSHGYGCERHAVNVACPRRVSGPRATGMEGWLGVPARFADGSVRHIPIPERELDEHGLSLDDLEGDRELVTDGGQVVADGDRDAERDGPEWASLEVVAGLAGEAAEAAETVETYSELKAVRYGLETFPESFYELGAADFANYAQRRLQAAHERGLADPVQHPVREALTILSMRFGEVLEQ